MHSAVYLLVALAWQAPADGGQHDDLVGAAHLEASASQCLSGEDSKDERSEVPPSLATGGSVRLASAGLARHDAPARAHRDAVLAHAARGPPTA